VALIAPVPWPVTCSNVPGAGHQRSVGAVRAATRPAHHRGFTRTLTLQSSREQDREGIISGVLHQGSAASPL
jgi:hypothetical protein